MPLFNKRINGYKTADSACLQHFCLIAVELQKWFYTKTVLNKKQQKICELETTMQIKRFFKKYKGKFCFA